MVCGQAWFNQRLRGGWPSPAPGSCGRGGLSGRIRRTTEARKRGSIEGLLTSTVMGIAADGWCLSSSTVMGITTDARCSDQGGRANTKAPIQGVARAQPLTRPMEDQGDIELYHHGFSLTVSHRSRGPDRQFEPVATSSPGVPVERHPVLAGSGLASAEDLHSVRQGQRGSPH